MQLDQDNQIRRLKWEAAQSIQANWQDILNEETFNMLTDYTVSTGRNTNIILCYAPVNNCSSYDEWCFRVCERRDLGMFQMNGEKIADFHYFSTPVEIRAGPPSLSEVELRSVTLSHGKRVEREKTI